MRQGQPQKYGTQYRVDAERRAWGVPPLAWSEQRAEEQTRETFGAAGEGGE